MNYEGVAVPYVLLDSFETLPVDYADNRNDGQNRRGFGSTLDEAMLTIDKADELLKTNSHLDRNFGFEEDDEYESTRAVALEQVLDHDDFAKDFEVDPSLVEELQVEEVAAEDLADEPVADNIEALSAGLGLPDEAVDLQTVVDEAPKEEKKKTLQERQKELAAEQPVSRETKDDDLEFGDF